MWPFALVALACVPIMGFASTLEMKRMLGSDDGDATTTDDKKSPGGIIVETLLNMRTVSALTLESQRFRDYEMALNEAEPGYAVAAFVGGFMSGISMFIQQWINGLQMWFGGYILTNYSGYVFKDFLIANFAVMFSLIGLGTAMQDLSDRKEVVKAAGRMFYLMDRKSDIDPLSDDGIVPGNKIENELKQATQNAQLPCFEDELKC